MQSARSHVSVAPLAWQSCSGLYSPSCFHLHLVGRNHAAPRPLRLCHGIHNPEVAHQSLHETILPKQWCSPTRKPAVCLAGECTQSGSTLFQQHSDNIYHRNHLINICGVHGCKISALNESKLIP